VIACDEKSQRQYPWIFVLTAFSYGKLKFVLTFLSPDCKNSKFLKKMKNHQFA